MTKRRMLHAKISVSSQVNRLSTDAQLLFTWMISHADDEGRLRGEPEHIKAVVVPMKKWSTKKIEIYVSDIEKQGLIYYWEEKGERIIEFVKWTEHQYIQKDRFKASTLPKYDKDSGGSLDTNRIQAVTTSSPQAKVNEVKEIEIKKSEINTPEEPNEEFKTVDPRTFKPTTESEVAAFHAWDQLEHNNLFSFSTTYLAAVEKGLPATMFYQFVSEIKQDSKIEKPGAVFNKKVEDYLGQ
jgi:aspartate carbamoyltransferase regulatory subunit